MKIKQKMTIRSQILSLIYAVSGSWQAAEFQSVAKCQNVRSCEHSEKQEEISGHKVHIHQLPDPDKDLALLQQKTQ